MKLIGSKIYLDLLKIFDEENEVNDARCSDDPDKDSWPRHRFKEAEVEFREWNEYELSYNDLLDVRLHWNKEFGIPQEGMTVRDAIQLESVRSWINNGKPRDLPEGSHIWLARRPLTNGPIEHRSLKAHAGQLVVLDGIHRIVAWASAAKEPILAFIAGKATE